MGHPTLEVIVAAFWLAMATGFAEGLYLLVRSEILGSLLFVHRGFFWMAPLAQLSFFAVPGILLAGAARLRPTRNFLAVSVTLLSLMGWLSLLLLVPGLQFWAWILASGGLATATGRLFTSHQDRCVLFFRRSAVWMGILLVFVAAVQAIVTSWREATAVASVPPAEEQAPNVLLIVLDTVRADALELYGADREVAPNLCELASRGVVFEQAWATSSWTLPSQAGMFTGRLPHELSADWKSPLDDSHPTLAEELSARGWLTGGFVGNTYYCSRETGLARGFTHYKDYRFSLADFALCTALGRKLLLSQLPAQFGRKSASEVDNEFFQWLQRREGRPFFAFLNYFDAHDPYVAPPAFRRYEPNGGDEALFVRNWWWVRKEKLSADQIAILQGAYEDCVRGLDWNVGQMLDRLRRWGELENTLIIITSDHGEHFAEHDLFLHGNSLYEPLLHVPLIVVWPGEVPADKRVDTPVSLSGLPNTIMELLGKAPQFPGDSWVRHWEDVGPPDRPAGLLSPALPMNAGRPTGARTHGRSTSNCRTLARPESIVAAELASQPDHPACHGRSPIAHGPMHCVREGSLKYIRRGDGTEEVYDLAQDPLEQNNVAGCLSYSAAVHRLRCLGRDRHAGEDAAPPPR
jgi:hypothetical protein